MLSCINKSSLEYQKLKEVSGIPESQLEWQCREFITEVGRFPNLDELYHVNTEPYLRDKLKMNKNVCSVKNLLQVTGTDNVSDAIIKLNNEYKDLQITGLELQSSVLLEIKHKPDMNNVDMKEEYNQDADNSMMIFNDITDTLSNLYGLKIVPITNLDIQNDQNLSQLIGNQTASAFIYNDTIYVNTDIASLDAPLHELLHIFVGGMRASNPTLYYQLVQQAEQFKTFDDIAQLYPNRTRGDLDEEVFINQLAKYLTGETNEFDTMDPKIKQDILCNTRSIINSVLMGDYNANSIINPYQYSIRELCSQLNSPLCHVKAPYIIEQARRSRIIANTKQSLLESKELQENCV